MDNYVFQNDDNRGIQRPYTINNRNNQRTFNNDYLVEVNSRANKFKRTVFFKRLSIGFLILALLFFIIMVVFIFLYLEKSEPKICTSKECLKTANNFLSSMDYTVDPCDNFYKFVCGRWSEEHPNHGWWNSFSSFTTIGEKVAITSMNVLKDANKPNEPEAIKKSRLFYKSCIDIETLDELGIATIYPFLKNMELPIIPSFMTLKGKTNVTFNWLRADALAKKILLMDVFIGATVGPNIFNGSENVLYIGQIYQTSPLPSPLKKRKGIMRKDSDKEGVKESVRDANSNLIKYLINAVIFNNTGQEANDDLLEKATIIIIDISDFIDEIVTNTTAPGVQDDETYTVTVEHLQKEINTFLNKPRKNFLINYLSYLFDGTNVTVNPKSDLLYVTDLDTIFLKMVIKYLTEIPDVNIELYMWWTTVYAMIFNTSNDIAEYITKQLNLFSSDSESIIRSRSLECALLTNNYMGYAISYALADQSFPNTTKPKVERMVMEIKESFESQVNGISWMDSKTKKATLEKSKQMMTFIGYPDWLFEKGKLDKYYSNDIIKPNRYLENMVNIIKSHAKDNLNSLRKPHKRDWYSEPIEVNAFNSFSDNAINIPMAILNFPLYHLGLEVLNYGSIGSILGHELIHGFDNTGRKHDKYGNYVQWWTNETIEAFENFTDCFVKQYENFTIPGVESHINGKVTLGENLADSGGLNQAFRAYTKYVSKYGEEPKLPGFENYSSYQLFFIAYASVNGKSTLGENMADNGGLNNAFKAYINHISKYGEEPKLPGFEIYNHYQLFFIAYASIWCETISTSNLEDQLQYDEHCPNFIRVLGVLQNSDDFANKFNCPKGSPMNPKKKCKIW